MHDVVNDGPPIPKEHQARLFDRLPYRRLAHPRLGRKRPGGGCRIEAYGGLRLTTASGPALLHIDERSERDSPVAHFCLASH